MSTVADVADLAEAVSLARYGPSAEFRRVRYCCRLLRAMFGDMEAECFGPVALRACQQHMVTGWSNGSARPGLARREINRRIGSIRHIFRVAVAYERIPPAVLVGLRTLEALRCGHTDAPEREPTRPVPENVWRDTLPHLGATVRAMVEVQACTGMRSCEVAIMRGCDVDRSGKTWTYTPMQHKSGHRGFSRVVAIGQRGRALLAPLLDALPPSEFLFSPQRDWPSTGRRGAHYTSASYSRAILRACLRGGVARWKPYSLRHLFLTKVRDAYGLDAVQVVAGHRFARTSEIYARANAARAMTIVEELG